MLKDMKEEKKAKREREKVAKEWVRCSRTKPSHLEMVGERNSCSKTDSDATFMRMKEEAMNNGQLPPTFLSVVTPRTRPRCPISSDAYAIKDNRTGQRDHQREPTSE